MIPPTLYVFEVFFPFQLVRPNEKTRPQPQNIKRKKGPVENDKTHQLSVESVFQVYGGFTNTPWTWTLKLFLKDDTIFHENPVYASPF